MFLCDTEESTERNDNVGLRRRTESKKRLLSQGQINLRIIRMPLTQYQKTSNPQLEHLEEIIHSESLAKTKIKQVYRIQP